jgi:hypothetical protein
MDFHLTISALAGGFTVVSGDGRLRWANRRPSPPAKDGSLRSRPLRDEGIDCAQRLAHTEPALNAFEIAFDGRLAAGRK